MALVTFVDDSTPYLNASNLNNNFDECGKVYSYNTTFANGTSNIYFKRYGHIVEVFYNGDITSLPSFESVTLLSNIPNEYRPDHKVKTSTERSGNENVIIDVNSDGTMVAFNYSSAITQATNFQFQFTYLV